VGLDDETGATSAGGAFAAASAVVCAPANGVSAPTALRPVG
jgi:hypothetical protein